MKTLDKARATLNILLGLFAASLVLAEALGVVSFTREIRWVPSLFPVQVMLFVCSAGVRYNSSPAGLARPRRPRVSTIVEVYAMFFTLLFGLSIWASGSELAEMPAIQESRKLLFGVAALTPVAFMVAAVYGWPKEAPPEHRVPRAGTTTGLR